MARHKKAHLSAQKAAEKNFLDQLIRLYPGFPRGRIVQSESPDFLVYTTPRRKIGIELTRLTRNSDTTFTGEDHFHPGFSMEAIQELIRNKEAKMELYRKNGVEGVWLVILVERFSQSPSFNLRNHVDHWDLSTLFKVVLILDLSIPAVYEIKTPAS
jgi:hypothetical protein